MCFLTEIRRYLAPLSLDLGRVFFVVKHGVSGSAGSPSFSMVVDQYQAGWWFGTTWLLYYFPFHIPIGSMYAIYGNIYHEYTPNVSIYTIHGSYGIWLVIRNPLTKSMIFQRGRSTSNQQPAVIHHWDDLVAP